ncbi:unnamed protein product, partial [Ascophyllum nodosum]
MATAGEVRLDPSARLIAARYQALPAIVAALEVGRKNEACSSGLPFFTTCRNGGTPGLDHPAAHHGVSVEAIHRRNNCGDARSTGSCGYAHDISRLCCRAGCNIDCGVDKPVCSRREHHRVHPNHVGSRSERRYHASAHPASGSGSGSDSGSASTMASDRRNCNTSSYFTVEKGSPVVPSSAGRTVGIASIQRVLQLGHGASQASGIRVNKTGWSEQKASKIPRQRQQKVAGEVQEEEDGDGGASVVIGILSFESLRQGALAVSSLFLTDETGKVRIVCVPVPPPSWLGEVVCISR